MGAVPIARLGYAQATMIWARYWGRRNLRFRRHDRLEPSVARADLLIEIDRQPTVNFWDSSSG